MSNFNVNISIEDVLNQKEQETVKFKPKTVFNEKNYLQARLANGEKNKEMTIRLLPFSQEETIPFHKVHMHTVRVNKEVSPSGWKTFPCPVKNHLGDKCPFCETAKQAKELEKLERIEAFDNSHLFGTFYVGGMVVFDEFIPNKNEYRKYK